MKPDDELPPVPIPSHEDLWALFHRLWGWSIIGRYEKRQWAELQQRLRDLGL